MATQYSEAKEVRDIAAPLIGRYHEHLIERVIRVDYDFVDPPMMRDGKTVDAVLKKISGFAAYKSRGAASPDERPYFALQVSSLWWESASPAERKYVVDRELCRAKSKENQDGDTVIRVAGYDLVDNCAAVERHGMMNRRVKRYARAIKRSDPQLWFNLPETDPEDAEEVVQDRTQATQDAVDTFDRDAIMEQAAAGRRDAQFTGDPGNDPAPQPSDEENAASMTAVGEFIGEAVKKSGAGRRASVRVEADALRSAEVGAAV